MLEEKDVRSPHVRGPLHQRLITLLNEQIVRGVCTQESLAGAVKLHQTTVSGILKRNAGTFDLDEAAAALDHVGSNLRDFLSRVPPLELSPTERLTRALAARPALEAMIAALLRVPKTRLAAVVELVRGVVPIAIGPRAAETDAPTTGSRPARRTTPARATRRSARARRDETAD